MRKLFAVAATVLLVAIVVGATIERRAQQIVKVGGAYNRMATIKGHVEILNNPELGRTAGTGVIWCSRGLVAVIVWWGPMPTRMGITKFVLGAVATS
jgi:hypothetical protein